MYQNHPTFRFILYIAALIAQVASFFVRAADPTGAWAQAVQDAANFLGGIGFVTAASNITSPPVIQKIIQRRRQRRERARSV